MAMADDDSAVDPPAATGEATVTMAVTVTAEAAETTGTGTGTATAIREAEVGRVPLIAHDCPLLFC